MSKNQSTLDRALRIAVGLGLLSLTVLGPQSAWGLVGLLPLVTGITGYCPAYRLFGVSTCPNPKAPAT
jgi:hypothetical protein